MSDWPSERKYIGKATPRVDGPLKVTGAAKYGSDVQPQGWLYGMILRSKWPAAKISSINLEPAKKLSGIKAAILVRDGERQVRFYGEELAAVCGTSKQACLDALRAIEIEATPLPFVVDELDAAKPDATRVFEQNPNLGQPSVKEQGEVDAAFAKAAAVVTATLQTSVQIHHPLETHGNTISVDADGVTAWASTQGVFGVREGLAGNLDIPQT